MGKIGQRGQKVQISSYKISLLLLLLSRLIVSDSVRPHRRQPTRLPRPRDSPGKNTGVGCHFLHGGIIYSMVTIVNTILYIRKKHSES